MYAHDLWCPTSAESPEVVGVCDRCGWKRYLADLVWQFDFRGSALQNLRIRVCKDRCNDVPFPFYKPIVIPPDPVPPKDPRPYQYAAEAAGSGPALPSLYSYSQATGPGTVTEPGQQAILP